MSTGIGIVGLGMIADFHAKAIAATQAGEVVAGCSRDQAKAEQFAGTHGGSGYTDYAQFLRHPGLEIVSICTPSGTHMEPALEAIEAGKHLIIEKPLEISKARYERILEAADRQGVTVAGVFQSRFFDVSRKIKQAIDAGRLGRLVLGDAYVKWFRTQQYYDGGGWHGTWKLDGGGALMNQSIHAVDLLLWFMGPVARIQAVSATLGHTGIEVEDTAVAALTFRNGALGVIEGSTAAYPGYHKRLEVAGTEGSVVSVQDQLEAWHFAKETPEDTAIREKYGAVVATGGGASDPANISFEGHQRQFEDLIEAIKAGRAPAVGGAEAVKSVDVILGIYESARTGQPVEL